MLTNNITFSAKQKISSTNIYLSLTQSGELPGVSQGLFCSNLEHHSSTANFTTKEWFYPQTDIGINYPEFICEFFENLEGSILTTRCAGTIFSLKLHDKGSQWELESRSNILIKKHQQHYRRLRIMYPDVEFFPYFIGPFATDDIHDRFMFGIKEVLVKLGKKKDQRPEWILIMPQSSAVILNVDALKTRMRSLKNDAVMACVMEVVTYDFNATNMRAPDKDTQGQKMRNFLLEVLKDTVPGWYMDNEWLRGKIVKISPRFE